jgi:hypothetical protein
LLLELPLARDLRGTSGSGRDGQLAHGTDMGPSHAIPVPDTAARELRLRPAKSSVTPTIGEIEVYRFAR